MILTKADAIARLVEWLSDWPEDGVDNLEVDGWKWHSDVSGQTIRLYQGIRNLHTSSQVISEDEWAEAKHSPVEPVAIIGKQQAMELMQKNNFVWPEGMSTFKYEPPQWQCVRLGKGYGLKNERANEYIYRRDYLAFVTPPAAPEDEGDRLTPPVLTNLEAMAWLADDDLYDTPDKWPKFGDFCMNNPANAPDGWKWSEQAGIGFYHLVSMSGFITKGDYEEYLGVGSKGEFKDVTKLEINNIPNEDMMVQMVQRIQAAETARDLFERQIKQASEVLWEQGYGCNGTGDWNPITTDWDGKEPLRVGHNTANGIVRYVTKELCCVEYEYGSIQILSLNVIKILPDDADRLAFEAIKDAAPGVVGKVERELLAKRLRKLLVDGSITVTATCDPAEYDN